MEWLRIGAKGLMERTVEADDPGYVKAMEIVRERV
jgi:hypothetical protein